MNESTSFLTKLALLKRIGNPLDWSIVDKVLLVLIIQIIFFCFLFFFLSIGTFFPNLQPDVFAKSFAGDILGRELFILGLYFAYLVFALILRKFQFKNKYFAYGLAGIISIHGCLWMSTLGYVTNPLTFLIVLAQALTGLLLFDLYFSLIIFLTWSLMFLIQVLGESDGVLQYAPHISQFPYFEGKIDGIWTFWNITGGVFITLMVFIIFTYIFNRWQQRETQVQELSELLKKMFGRYLSKEVMDSLISNPSALELGGERRKVVIMMTDLRGFTAISERLEPEQVVQMLNTYFEVMVDIIYKYDGTIVEFIGDALLVLFGAPHELHDRSERSIGCAIEMQNAMDGINKKNMLIGLPELEMGIGINETEVIVGNVGSTKRSHYTAIGSGVNIASRIESYTVGGQILISESVMKSVSESLRIDGHQNVTAKGAERPIKIYEVGAISGKYNLILREKDNFRLTLTQKIPIYYSTLGGKKVGDRKLSGYMTRLSKTSAEVFLEESVNLMTNLKFNLADVGGDLGSKDFYGKVTGKMDDGKNPILLTFTSVLPEINSYFQAFLKYAEKGTASAALHDQ